MTPFITSDAPTGFFSARNWRFIATCVAAAALAFAVVAWRAGLLPADLASSQTAAASVRTSTASNSLPNAAQLIAATQVEMPGNVAEGQDAKLINASLPFSAAAVEAASPFRISASPDQNTALHCLTQAIYYEAGYEPLEGRRAVAQVVINRMRHPAFPKSVCGVVYQGSNQRVCQFSFTCDGSLARTPSRSAWQEAAAIAREALNGAVVPSVGHATHYHTDYVAPYWAPKLSKIRQIGAHIFYTWPGNWGRRSAFRGSYAGFEQIPSAKPAELIPAVLMSEEIATADAAPVPAVQEAPRAPNDVGGRLDVSKGWKLSIPDPVKSPGSLSKVMNTQTAGAASTREVAVR